MNDVQRGVIGRGNVTKEERTGGSVGQKLIFYSHHTL
jgi:hypothetical protein